MRSATFIAIGTVCLLLAGCDADRSGDVASKPPVYSIDGNAVELEGGKFESEDGTITLLISTSGDLNGDDAADQAVILVRNSHGSGVFYYLNVLLNGGNGALGLVGGAFLGDRIRFEFMDVYGPVSVLPQLITI